jgi:hypothetical protein
MPLSNRRRARRKEIQLQETSDVEAPDSSPSRPSNKKRKVSSKTSVYACGRAGNNSVLIAVISYLIARLTAAPTNPSKPSPAMKPRIQQASMTHLLARTLSTW